MKNKNQLCICRRNFGFTEWWSEWIYSGWGEEERAVWINTEKLTVQRLQGSHQTSADVSQSHSCSHTSSTWRLWPSTCEGQRCWKSPVIRTWSCVINFHFYVLSSHSTCDKLYLAFTASERHFCHIYPVWANVHVYSQNDIWFRYALILYTTEQTLMQSRTPAVFTFYNESPNKAVLLQVCYQWQTSISLFCVNASWVCGWSGLF